VIWPFRKKIDFMASLGTNCEMAYNLRQTYGLQQTGLLDWMITPLSAIPPLIGSHFDLIGNDFEKQVEHVELAGGADSIMHMKTGILLHHAFPRDCDDRIADDWKDKIPEVVSKYRFLGERMHLSILAAKRPIFFLNRAGLHDALPSHMVKVSTDSDIYCVIFEALIKAYPTSRLVIMNGDKKAIEELGRRPRVLVADVADKGDWHEGVQGHFGGRREEWCNSLKKLKLQ